MERFLCWVEDTTSRKLTKRKARKAYNRQKKRTFLSETLEWIDAIVFGVFWVIIINQFLFQLFVIPSPSMVSTLLVGDRVVVSKTEYGIEVYPGGPKLFESSSRVQRDDIITFYNPEYDSRGPVFDILSQAIYMGTLSLVNIDKDSDGNVRERLFVKRCAALGGDRVKFVDGNVYIKAAGTGEYVPESEFREENGLSTAPQRSVDETLYDALKAVARIEAYASKDLSYPNYLVREYSAMSGTDYDYKFDLYEFNRAYYEELSFINPSDASARSASARYRTGIYVPDGSVLPLGDNRDNSQDGRYFGPVSEDDVNGRVIARFWPLNRIDVLTDD